MIGCAIHGLYQNEVFLERVRNCGLITLAEYNADQFQAVLRAMMKSHKSFLENHSDQELEQQIRHSRAALELFDEEEGILADVEEKIDAEAEARAQLSTDSTPKEIYQKLYNRRKAKLDYQSLVDHLKIQPEDYAAGLMKLKELLAGLNDKQKTVISYILHQKSNNKQVLLSIEGAAGTGKTHTLNAISLLYNIHLAENLILTATTGTAASALGGQTIDKALGFTGKHGVSSHAPRSLEINLLSTVDAVVIDEASMLSSEKLHNVDLMLKRACPGIQRATRPFADIDIILCGDPSQFAPVITNGVDLGNLAFSPLFRKNFIRIELTEQQRQKDDNSLTRVLDKIKVNASLNEEELALL